MREDEIIQFRYPGSKPFEISERHLFFGRESDAEKFYRLVKIQPIVVLYSKSGVGKSSLINAAVIPQAREEQFFEPLRIRFELYTEGKKETPLDILRKKITPNGSAVTFLDKLIKDEPSLWHDIKEFQIERQKGLLLIFDQFEELFSYPDESIRQFKAELEEAIYTVIPDRYAHVLEKQMSENKLTLDSDQIQLLQTPPEVKILISIRSDRKYLLDKLADSLPNLQKVGYELNPLEIADARSAITSPAKIKDANLASPTFGYDETALQVMLDFLTKSGAQKVEPFQLQILCNVLEKKIQTKNQVLTAEDLGDVSKIYENYYENQLNQIEDPSEREAARRLIEDGLILEEEERRLTLYEGQILRDYHIKPKTLYQLVNSHLLRSEPSDSGGFMYELSHDSLVEPVLEAKARHLEAAKKEEEARQKKEEEQQRERERKAQEAELARQQAIADQERQLREEAQKNLRRAQMWARIATGALVVLLLLVFSTLDFYVDAMKSTGKMLDKEEKYQDAISIYEKARGFDLLGRWNLKQAIANSVDQKAKKEEYDRYVKEADSLFYQGEENYLMALALYEKALATDYKFNKDAQIKKTDINNRKSDLSLKFMEEGKIMFDAAAYTIALEKFKLADAFSPNQSEIQEKINETLSKINQK